MVGVVAGSSWIMLMEVTEVHVYVCVFVAPSPVILDRFPL